METQQLAMNKKRQQAVDAVKVQKRGREALEKEKNHNNYLRLLEALDKMDKTSNGSPGTISKDWDIESTVASDEPTYREPSPVSRTSPWMNDPEQIPVRDLSTAGESPFLFSSYCILIPLLII